MNPYPLQLDISGPTAMWTRPDTGSSPVSCVVSRLNAVKGIVESVLRWKSVKGGTGNLPVPLGDPPSGMVGNENSLQGATARNKSAIHATRPQTTAGRTGTAARTCSLPYRDEHPPPHFHASYGEFSAQISIRQPAVLRGRLPPRVLGYVTEWAVLHEEELLRC